MQIETFYSHKKYRVITQATLMWTIQPNKQNKECQYYADLKKKLFYIILQNLIFTENFSLTSEKVSWLPPEKNKQTVKLI